MIRANTGFQAGRAEPSDSREDFPTPPWATRAALVHLAARGVNLAASSVWEPCANRGHMVRPLAEVFGAVAASDIADYGAGFEVRDFLAARDDRGAVDWVFMNPPFNLSVAFFQRAQSVAAEGVAVFQRLAFVEGRDRYDGIFEGFPPTDILHFCERVVIHKGVMLDPDRAYLSPPRGYAKPSTMAAYAWFIWRKGVSGVTTQTHWLAPGTRARLTRPGDYPEDPRGVAVIENRGVLIDG